MRAGTGGSRARILYCLLIPALLLPVLLVFGVDKQDGYGHDYFLRARDEAEASGKKLARLQQEYDLLTNLHNKQKNELQNLKIDIRERPSRTEQSQPVIPIQSDPTDVGGQITIIAVATACNCPALIGSYETAIDMVHKESRQAYIHSFPKRPYDAVGCTIRTDAFASACNGKERCAYKYTSHDNHIVTSCPGKLMIDFRCGNKETRNVVLYDPPEGSDIILDCGIPRALKKVVPHVEWVTPILHRHKNTDFSIWPIGFSIPSSRMLGSIPWKNRDFASLIPGNSTTYVHTQQTGKHTHREPETEYFHDYRHSLYCVTRKKKGWDALRHYEILASGCIPYFIDIQRMPANTMVWYPKKLVDEAMHLPGVTFNDSEEGSFWDPGSYKIDKDVFDIKRYYELAVKIQAHARRYLSSEAMAGYILKAMHKSGGLANPKRVLYIHHCYHDFMGDALWTGFKDLELKGFLDKVIDIVPSAELSNNGAESPWGKLYKMGNCKNGRKLGLMTSHETLQKRNYYTWVNGWGNHRSHNMFPADESADESKIPEMIRKKEFDVIVYATPEKTAAWLDLASQYYPKSQIALLNGGDPPAELNTIYQWSLNGTVFVREIYEESSEYGFRNSKVCFDSPGIAEAQGFDCCGVLGGGAKNVWTNKKGDGATWNTCAKENQHCTCKREVRFGDPVGRRWASFDWRNGSELNILCKNLNAGGIFSDPAVGAPKHCECRVTD